MYSSVICGIVVGVTGLLVRVEVELRNGIPYFTMVGQPSREAKEAKERVEAALRAIGSPLPPGRITVNLSPANVKKSGTAFDFPIAVALLWCLGSINHRIDIHNICILGELGLDGSIHGTMQCLPIVLEAKKEGIRTFFVSIEDYHKLSLVEDIQIIPMKDLSDVIAYFQDGKIRKVMEPRDERKNDCVLDFSDIKGQNLLKRATEIAITGKHNILLIGSPGSGKTMLFQRIPSILQPLSKEEQLEVQSIYSAAMMNQESDAMPPFRTPHSTISLGAFIGGGGIPKPGEITLAHKGILFLDEISEYRTECLEALRQPLEDKRIVLNRLGRSYIFPTDFQLLATMNPCPCGHYFTPEKCNCNYSDLKRYYKRLSGPLLDRFDMILLVRENSYQEENTESSSTIKERIKENVKRQSYMLKETPYNKIGDISRSKEFGNWNITKEARNLLQSQLEKGHLSMRGYDKVLKVAKTISIMDGKEEILPVHVIEALSYRQLQILQEVLAYEG